MEGKLEVCNFNEMLVFMKYLSFFILVYIFLCQFGTACAWKAFVLYFRWKFGVIWCK